jgi:hypothetical protein
MTDALVFLLPLIVTFAAIGVGCMILVALAGKWARWPDPEAWESRIGRIEPRKVAPPEAHP